MNSLDVWLTPQQDGRRFLAAIGLGLIIELVALTLLLPALNQQKPPARQESVVKLSIQAAPPPPKPAPPAPKPPPPLPQPVAPARPVPPPPPPVPHHAVHHSAPPRPVPPPPAQAAPPIPPTPPAPALPPAPSLGEIDQFRVAMRDAVQRVANGVYPQAAQMAHETGAPAIGFTYRDGVVTNIALIRSSGYPLLDEAALQAARIAHYPPPPAGFAGRTYTVIVTVIFQMAAPSVDGD